jgi:hypothetical protein
VQSASTQESAAKIGVDASDLMFELPNKGAAPTQKSTHVKQAQKGGSIADVIFAGPALFGDLMGGLASKKSDKPIPYKPPASMMSASELKQSESKTSVG